MNVSKYLTMGLALAVLALGLTTAHANAQPVLKGSFELPAAAYWGDTLLQPGQYTIWMSTEASSLARVPVVRVTGEGLHLAFLAITRPQRESGGNYLEIADINGTYVVRAFDAGLIGRSFTFGVTKTVKNKALRASAKPVMSVPVSSAAGF